MDSSDSVIGEEQTLVGNSETLGCGNSEEILVVDEHPVVEKLELENPSPNFAKSDEILRGSVSGMLKFDEVSGIEENPIKESAVLENPVSDNCECETLDIGGIFRIVEFEESVLDCCKSGEALVGSPMIIEDNARIEKTLDEIPKTRPLENPVLDCCETGGVIDGSLTFDTQVTKSLDEFPETMLLENPCSDCCETGGVTGGCSVMDDNSVASSLKEIPETMQLENSVSDCCETGGIIGESLMFDAQVTKSLDEIPETMPLENPFSVCCETGGITGGCSAMGDDDIARSLKEIPQTMLLENPVSDCCETGGIIGGSSVINDAYAVSTLEETAQHVTTRTEFIQDCVPKVKNVQLGKGQEDCDTPEGVNVENVQVVSASDILEDDDEDMISVNDVIDHGCCANSNANGTFGPLRQYFPKGYDYNRRSFRRPCYCDQCSDGEDEDERFHRMAGHNPNRDYLNHPYFSDPHLNRRPYRKREHNLRSWRRMMGFIVDERDHDMMLRVDSHYRMQYYELMYRPGGPDCIDVEAEPSPFYGPNFMDRERGYMDRVSGWNSNRFWGRSEPEPEPCPVGAGLSNLGNTCFLNAIIQCFTHTVLLVEGLQSLKHESSSHGQDEFCVLCAVRHQIECSLKFSGKILSPSILVDNLNQISSFFRKYQQEDAHEFLLSLLDKLDSNWSKHEVDSGELSSSHNSLVKQIFGGRLVSQLHCCTCGHNSDSYEPLVDLSLGVEDVDDLESAFKSFTRVENIEDITCDNCKEKVLKEKHFLIDEGPPVAAVHLKRFKSDGFRVEKIDRMVKYPLELDLEPYAKGAGGDNEDLKYELYGFVVHVGLSPTSGHYFCYIRTSPDAWYRFDDSKVTKVSECTALDQEAYILFYARKGTPWFGDLLEKWKSLLQEKSIASPKSVLEPTNLPPSCQDSEQNDCALVVYAEPLSSLNLDEADTEILIPAQESTEATTSNAGEDNQDDETGSAKFENRSIPNVENSVLSGPENDDVDINPCISPEPGSPNMNSDKSLTAEQLTYQIPLDHLKSEEKKSLSVKQRLGKSKQDLEKKQAAKYVKSSMRFGRRKLFVATLNANRSESLSKKRRKQWALMHKHSPRKRVKTSLKPSLRTVAATV